MEAEDFEIHSVSVVDEPVNPDCVFQEIQTTTLDGKVYRLPIGCSEFNPNMFWACY